MKTLATKVPRLQKGNDKEVAAELGRLVRDAQDGTRRILICGLFIETIVTNLKHGELEAWVEAHEAEIGAKKRAIFGWRNFAKETLAFLKIEIGNALPISKPLHEILALPIDKVPEYAREERAKIDDLLEGRSVKQLMLNFRECEVFEDELVRTGRGGDRTAHRGPRRTKAEIEKDVFENGARVACADARKILTHLLTHKLNQAPNSPRAWDILDDKALKELKEMAIDLRDGILASESRRVKFQIRTK